MADPIITFTIANIENAVLNVGTNKTIPIFKITYKGCTSLKVFFPIYDKDKDEKKRHPQEICLFSKEVWKKLVIVEEHNPAGITIEKKGQFVWIEGSDKTKTEAEITFSLQDGKNDRPLDPPQLSVIEKNGCTECYIKYPKIDEETKVWVKNKESILTVTRAEKKPEINYFIANKYVLRKSEELKLVWSTALAEDIKLNDRPIELKDGHGQYDEIKDKVVKDSQYSLKVTNNVGSTSSSLSIEVLDSSKLALIGKFPEDSIVMGIYSNGKTFYALVLPHPHSAEVSVYQSPNGINISSWKKIYIDEPEVDKQQISKTMAGSPGVFFKGRLYLIGGSRLDRKQPGNDVGYYNPGSNTFTKFGKEEMTPFSERMGHACIVTKDDKGEDKEIWVLGGYHPDRSECYDDIWVSDNGKFWQKKENIKMPGGGRCMMGAALYNNEVVLIGGFKMEPGGKPWRIKDAIKYGYNGWKTIIWQSLNSDLSTFYFCASSLSISNEEAVKANTQEALYLFIHNYSPNTERKVYKINSKASDEWLISDVNGNISQDWGDWDGGAPNNYDVQTNGMNGLIFLTMLKRASKESGGVAGKSPYYFYP